MTADSSSYDVVVVGSGAAGLMAAVIAGDDCRVAVLTDRGLGTSNSAVAQGGLQLPDDDAGSVARFRSDMVVSGGPNIDSRRLDHFVSAVRGVVLLLEEWGLELDVDDDGNVRKIGAGGLSEPRIVTAGERIGPAILKVLRRRIVEVGVDVHTRRTVTGISVDSSNGRLLIESGNEHFDARSVVIATGGRSYQHAEDMGLATSNPINDNAQMHQILRALGLRELDADVFQLHPYGIVDLNGASTGKCVPESVSAMGAFVSDRSGRRLAAPGTDRAGLTAAMDECMSRGDGVELGGSQACRLVLSQVDEAALYERYPHTRRHLAANRLDNGDVAVRPVVHYQLGGFEVEPDGATTVPGLYLAGEITGGLHGRNRLMGNGITEAVVDGWTAGHAVISRMRDLATPPAS